MCNDSMIKTAQTRIRLEDEQLSVTGTAHFVYCLETDFPLSDADMDAITRIVASMGERRVRTYHFTRDRSELAFNYGVKG